MNTTNKSFLCLAMLAAFVFISGNFFEAAAQRDPFEKPAWARTKDPKTGGNAGSTGKGPGSATFGVPAVEQRIEYYKRLREAAVANSTPVPKVTSVLTLDELAVTGIFKTPRGYAAMVEAMPIKLTYTIYPGEKFFDGQLVAVEENRLVFRKVTKAGNGKFVSSVENKSLRKYTDRDLIQGTAPAGAETKEDAQRAAAAAPAAGDKTPMPAPIVSPMTEMEKTAPAKAEAEKAKTPAKTSVRVAKKKQ